MCIFKINRNKVLNHCTLLQGGLQGILLFSCGLPFKLFSWVSSGLVSRVNLSFDIFAAKMHFSKPFKMFLLAYFIISPYFFLSFFHHLSLLVCNVLQFLIFWGNMCELMRVNPSLHANITTYLPPSCSLYIPA